MKKIILLFSFVCALFFCVGKVNAEDTIRIPNHSFEQFAADGVPTGWNTLANPLPLPGTPKYFSKVSKDPNGYIGSAAKMETSMTDLKGVKTLLPVLAQLPDTIVTPGMLMLGNIDLLNLLSLAGTISGGGGDTSVNGLIQSLLGLVKGGYKLTNNQEPQAISGYYKAIPKTTNDLPAMVAFTTRYNKEAGAREIISFAASVDLNQNISYLVPNYEFVPFSFDFTKLNTTVAADSMYIMFFSSLNLVQNSLENIGSSFWVDELKVTVRTDTPADVEVINIPAPKEVVFNVYPNPVKGSGQLKLATSSTKAVKINVYNMVGKLYSSEMLKNGDMIYIKDNGIYFVEAFINGQRYTSKVIVSR